MNKLVFISFQENGNDLVIFVTAAPTSIPQARFSL